MASEHRKGCSTSLARKATQIKTTKRDIFTPSRRVIMKERDNNE